MELRNFFKLLYKHKLTLVIVPVVAVIITFFLVRNQADTYMSQSQIATGIVDQTQKQSGSTISDATDLIQDSQVSQEFSNLIQIIQSKKMLDQVSYQLMLHDLKSDHPFRKPSKLLLQLNEDARDHAIDVYTDKYNKREPLSLFSSDESGLQKVLASMGYDGESLKKKLSVYRADASDFINIEYESENPQLSALTVNTLTNEFINYYTSLVKNNQVRAVTFLGKEVQTKMDTLNHRTEALKNYKIRNQVLNLEEEARTLYGQIADFETRLAQAKRESVSNYAAMNSIDKQFRPNDRRYLEASLTRINQQILNSRTQLEALNQQYIESGFEESYRPRIDSLTRVIANQINQSGDKYIVNPLNTKANLIQQKLNLQVQYDLSRNSIGAINNELTKLNKKLTVLVPNEAVIQAYESSIALAREEYTNILARYNQTRMEADFAIQLRQIQTGMPGQAQPSKKMLLVIISGIVTFIFGVVILFGLFLLDKSVHSPRELANSTKVPVVGYLYRLGGSTVDLRKVWNDTDTDGEMRLFRNLLQSIRFEIDNILAGRKVVLINSLSQSEGKTFLAMNLAYAYSLINKRVLLIDGNFANTGITRTVNARLFIEDYLKGTLPDTSLVTNSKITILGNKNGDISILEVSDEKRIKERLNRLKEMFDVIIIESSALNTLNKSKEWTLFADKVFTVFKAGNSIKDTQKPNLRYLKSLNKRFAGWILNEVEQDQQVADVRE
ncbi:polysaccharide biosynthesis tyrosine autokinase [Mucilaginibacter koreensis]